MDINVELINSVFLERLNGFIHNTYNGIARLLDEKA